MKEPTRPTEPRIKPETEEMEDFPQEDSPLRKQCPPLTREHWARHREMRENLSPRELDHFCYRGFMLAAMAQARLRRK